MKARIIITPKKAVLDPQGKTVQQALSHMGYTGIGDVHVGKYLENWVSTEQGAVWHPFCTNRGSFGTGWPASSSYGGDGGRVAYPEGAPGCRGNKAL